MHSTDRIVLAGTGFGVWQDGRHLASARWVDVSQVRAFNHHELTTDRVRIALRLRNGTEILVHAEHPGFEQFLVAAEARLPGMLRRSAWWSAAVQPDSAPNEMLLFERGVPKG